MSLRAKKRFVGGFTLIEAIFIIVLLGVIVGMSAPFIATTIDSWLISNSERNVIFSARLAINRMNREIRQAKLILGTPTSTFFNFTDINNSTIAYYKSGTSLYRNSDELTNLLDSGSGLQFIYYNSIGGITNDTLFMRRVGMELNLVSDESGVNMKSMVRFRNMK